jgi:hypothetical protein
MSGWEGGQVDNGLLHDHLLVDAGVDNHDGLVAYRIEIGVQLFGKLAAENIIGG